MVQRCFKALGMFPKFTSASCSVFRLQLPGPDTCHVSATLGDAVGRGRNGGSYFMAGIDKWE